LASALVPAGPRPYDMPRSRFVESERSANTR